MNHTNVLATDDLNIVALYVACYSYDSLFHSSASIVYPGIVLYLREIMVAMVVYFIIPLSLLVTNSRLHMLLYDESEVFHFALGYSCLVKGGSEEELRKW